MYSACHTHFKKKPATFFITMPRPYCPGKNSLLDNQAAALPLSPEPGSSTPPLSQLRLAHVTSLLLLSLLHHMPRTSMTSLLNNSPYMDFSMLLHACLSSNQITPPMYSIPCSPSLYIPCTLPTDQIPAMFTVLPKCSFFVLWVSLHLKLSVCSPP